jgi:hypothetical protein
VRELEVKRLEAQADNRAASLKRQVGTCHVAPGFKRQGHTSESFCHSRLLALTATAPCRPLTSRSSSPVWLS